MPTDRTKRTCKRGLALSKWETLNMLHLCNSCIHLVYYKTHEFKWNILIKIVIEIQSQSIIVFLNYEANWFFLMDHSLVPWP